ncbi:MAG: hypothetical protein KA212_05090, partial [Burkholderiaceae bacterium]|nr:hypothetical protein [Burkholderiaceae bacterium]
CAAPSWSLPSPQKTRGRLAAQKPIFWVNVFFEKPQQRPSEQKKIWNPKTAAWGVQMFSVFFSNASINT